MIRLADFGKSEVGKKQWPAVGFVGVSIGRLVGERSEI